MPESSGKVFGDCVPQNAPAGSVAGMVRRYVLAGYAREATINLMLGTGMAKPLNEIKSAEIGRLYDEIYKSEFGGEAHE